jgi:hypothetical protein
MENEILELKTCIAVYQKKYTEVVNLNVGLESKLMYFSERIKELERVIDEQRSKLEGTNVEKILIQAQQDVASKHTDISQKVINIENRISHLMKLDERMHDLEGGMSCMTSAAEELIKVKDKIVSPVVEIPKSEPTKTTTKSKAKQKTINTPKFDATIYGEVAVGTGEIVISEEATVAEDGGEF